MNCNGNACEITMATQFLKVSDVDKQVSILSAQANSQLQSFEEKCFYGCKSLTKVNLSYCNSLKEIANDVFSGCSQLSTVILPKDGSLETICGGAFYGTAITSITFPETLKYLKSTSGKNGAFAACRKLNSIQYYSKNNVESISSFVFAHNSFNEFVIGPNLKDVSGISFESSSSTFTSFIMNEESENPFLKVYRGILYDFTYSRLIYCPAGRTNIELPEGVSTICNDAFQVNRMTECQFLSNTTKVLESYAFNYCLNMRRIFLPDSIVSIGASCFESCFKLESIIIPPKVTILESNVLYDAYSLRNIVLYDTLRYIHDNAFNHLDSMNKCGIVCSLSMRGFLQKEFHFPDISFMECKVTKTFHSHKYHIQVKYLVFSLLLI